MYFVYTKSKNAAGCDVGRENSGEIIIFPFSHFNFFVFPKYNRVGGIYFLLYTYIYMTCCWCHCRYKTSAVLYERCYSSRVLSLRWLGWKIFILKGMSFIYIRTNEGKWKGKQITRLKVKVHSCYFVVSWMDFIFYIYFLFFFCCFYIFSQRLRVIIQ